MIPRDNWCVLCMCGHNFHSLIINVTIQQKTRFVVDPFYCLWSAGLMIKKRKNCDKNRRKATTTSRKELWENGRKKANKTKNRKIRQKKWKAKWKIEKHNENLKRELKKKERKQDERRSIVMKVIIYIYITLYTYGSRNIAGYYFIQHCYCCSVVFLEDGKFRN